MADPERIISVCKLPDGRYAVKNERDVSDLTEQDEDEMAHALLIWFQLRRRSREPTDEPRSFRSSGE